MDGELLVQLGHERALVEIIPAPIQLLVVQVASMGPRARARGNILIGAAYTGTDLLQWGHERALVEMPPRQRNPVPAVPGFNGATSARSWKYLVGGIRGLPTYGFNGATSARSWKLTPTECDGSKLRSFKGATSARSWKSWRRNRTKRASGCFNGATSARSWK